MDTRPDQGLLRQRMTITSNERARRTRAKLVDAYRVLATDGGSSISVADVVQQADVNRTTFYAHFNSIQALAVEAFAGFADTIGAFEMHWRHQGEPGLASLNSLRQVIDYVAERQAVYTELLGDGTSTFFAATEEAFVARNVHMLESIGVLQDPRDIAVTARFLAAGFVGVIAQWLRDGMDEPPAELAGRLLGLMPPYLPQNPGTGS